MKFLFAIPIVIMALLGSLFAEDTYDQIVSRSGRTFKKVKVIKTTPLEIRIIHEGGGTTILLAELPGTLQPKYEYCVEKAKAYSETQRAAENASAKAEIERKARAKLMAQVTREKKDGELLDPGLHVLNIHGEVVDVFEEGVIIQNWIARIGGGYQTNATQRIYVVTDPKPFVDGDYFGEHPNIGSKLRKIYPAGTVTVSGTKMLRYADTAEKACDLITPRK